MDLPADPLHPFGLRITQLGIDQGVHQMGLPPVLVEDAVAHQTGGQPATPS